MPRQANIAERERILTKLHKSGLSVEEFCKKEKLNKSTIYAWKAAAKKAPSKKTTAKKAPAKKTTAKKAPAKKAATKKFSAKHLTSEPQKTTITMGAGKDRIVIHSNSPAFVAKVAKKLSL